MLVTQCRMCKHTAFWPFLDLGRMPPADQFWTADQVARGEQSYPLRVMLCEHCGLIQLDYVVPPEILYCNEYPYESSTTSTGRRHWQEFASTVAAKLGLTAQDLVVEMGSNVGVLLESFKKHGIRIQGVDPASNLAEVANRNGIDTMPAFFSSEAAAEIARKKGKASVIIGTNVFAHIHDLDDVMRAVDLLLNDKGVFVLEAPRMIDLIREMLYDTIYHEHLSYLSLKPLVAFFQRFGMEVFDVQLREMHGGSFRVFVRRKNATNAPIADTVAEMVAEEEEAGIYSRSVLSKFAADVAKNRADLRDLVFNLKAQGKRVVAVSAPAKGMTLLNYCGLDNTVLDFITEKAALKLNRLTPGTHIPVVPDAELIAQQPDYALLLAWNFSTEIMNNLKPYSAAGGKFIIPIPRPHIVG